MPTKLEIAEAALSGIDPPANDEEFDPDLIAVVHPEMYQDLVQDRHGARTMGTNADTILELPMVDSLRAKAKEMFASERIAIWMTQRGYATGHGDTIEDMLVELEGHATARLRDALLKLSNEVLASLPLMEPLCRREFGNSNYAILIQRAEEARSLLAESI